ncbi:MAG: efflux RND transporter periplasmic adaptor subunit, partial [Chloroflexi bacterium]|nr:efflux RND transporter periplasmic adaptor subunit [Chloroflexota bacterium]
MDNTALLRSIAITVAICALISTCLGCNKKTATPAPQTQIVTIQHGDLTISVPVDGNLVMPQAFDLRFGTPGDVKDVLVEEGDHVKAGAILAMLDNTAQRLDIQSANSSLQKVLSNLYQT